MKKILTVVAVCAIMVLFYFAYSNRTPRPVAIGDKVLYIYDELDMTVVEIAHNCTGSNYLYACQWIDANTGEKHISWFYDYELAQR